MSTNGTSIDYRKAADEVWDLARDAEKRGFFDLAELLKDMATEIHNKARLREKTEDNENK